MKRGWKNYLFYSSIVLVVGGLIYILVETINRKNTGFETKTLWDWMELLIIPAVLAGGAILINRSERAIEREIATDRQQESALQAYIGKISDLLLEKKLRTTKRAEVRDVARTLTISALRGLDTRRSNLVIQFLREANLINTPNSIFNRVSMEEMNLQRLNLRVVYLQGANLQDADLRRANLERTNLQDADLRRANLERAFLERTNLQDADLLGANLKRAFLERANLQGANIQEANLVEAHLAEANLQGARMFFANLQGANMNGANMQDANMNFANLQDTYWIKANLRDANLRDANLRRANLTGADLEGANLQNAKNITNKQLASVKSLKGATMPNGTKHE